MNLKPVFWPIGCRASGYYYGWSDSVICVAGVITTNNREEAETVVNAYASSGLRILGKCDGDRNHSPRLEPDSVGDHYIIFYHQHSSKSLRFYSLDPLKLDESGYRVDPKTYLVQKQLEHDFTTFRDTETEGLDCVMIEKLNAAGSLVDLLQQKQKRPLHAITIAFQSSLGVITTPLNPVFSIIGRLLSLLCNIPISVDLDALNLHYVLLKDVSAIIQQVDVRAEQMTFLSTEIKVLSQRDGTPLPTYSARYTNFFNTVWLILNDITIGYAFGIFLIENHELLAAVISRHTKGTLIVWVQWVLHWLDSWPAGLKLNTELSWFYSYTFIDLVAMWGTVLERLLPHLPTVIYGFGLISSFGGVLGGMAMAISLFCDTLTIFTAHIYVCYVITYAVYARALKTAASLWNLFRGKRYNVLRNRTDSWEYDVDHLLFGTILFTLLAFLFPTILVYYLLFALLRLGTILVQASLETQLAFMNHFPLFALMLRAKDPWRLPGGLYFSRTSFSGVNGTFGPTLVLENQPIPLSVIFFQYTRLWARLASHYNPIRLLKCLLAGEFLSPIPRYEIRYNKIREAA